MDKQKGEIVCFLHNVSPTKKSNKTSYFDISKRTANGLIRGFCFSTSKQEHFNEISYKKILELRKQEMQQKYWWKHNI